MEEAARSLADLMMQDGPTRFEFMTNTLVCGEPAGTVAKAHEMRRMAEEAESEQDTQVCVCVCVCVGGGGGGGGGGG